MLAVQVCCARHCELPLSKMGNKGLFPGVAVPLAFFMHTFLSPPKEKCERPLGRPVPIRAGVGASNPHRQKRACTCGRTKGLSSGQTIGAVRTAVRSACCLPERRVANRLRRLYPLDTRFPSFPYGNLRPRRLAKFSHGAASPATRAAVSASSPRRELFTAKLAFCHRLPK